MWIVAVNYYLKQICDNNQTDCVRFLQLHSTLITKYSYYFRQQLYYFRFKENETGCFIFCGRLENENEHYYVTVGQLKQHH